MLFFLGLIFAWVAAIMRDYWVDFLREKDNIKYIYIYIYFFLSLVMNRLSLRVA